MQGADEARNKPTYPAIIGMDASKEEAKTLYDDAMASLSDIGEEADLLRAVADFIVNRKH
jgi:farnesyl diphosphate synthase